MQKLMTPYAFVRVLAGCCVIVLFLQPAAAAAVFSTAGVRLEKKVKPMREIKRQGVVPQSLDFSCGAAGLSTLLNFYLDHPVSEADIINHMLQVVPLQKVKERKGFSLYDLKNFAEMSGYKVTGYKMDMEFLKKLDKPVLVPIKFRNYRHFVVVRGVIADRVLIADPAAGNMSMKIGQFEDIWLDGIGLVVEDMSKSAPNRDYVLKIRKQDYLVTNYKSMQRLINPDILRTAIFPGEF